MEVSGSDEAKVRCISHHTIRSATQTHSTQRLELTPWDLVTLALHPIQKGFFFHKPYGNTWVSDLKTSLSLVLHHFFPLAGRLVTESHDDDDGTISIFIQCNNAGAEFIHAKADVSLSDVLNPLYIPSIVQDFFSLNYSINYEGTSKPLLSIQVNELLDGVFIGCTMNHMIGDGASFWHFMNSWSEICRRHGGFGRGLQILRVCGSVIVRMLKMVGRPDLGGSWKLFCLLKVEIFRA